MGAEAVPFPVIQPEAHLTCAAIGAFEQHHAAIPQAVEFMFGFGLQQVQLGKAAGLTPNAGWGEAALLQMGNSGVGDLSGFHDGAP
jgi:hypothetical protein